MSGKQLSTVSILCKHLILFAVGGGVYCGLEQIFRGRTHWTMFIVGGLCLIFCGLLNERREDAPLWQQMLLGFECSRTNLSTIFTIMVLGGACGDLSR